MILMIIHCLVLIASVTGFEQSPIEIIVDDPTFMMEQEKADKEIDVEPERNDPLNIATQESQQTGRASIEDDVLYENGSTTTFDSVINYNNMTIEEFMNRMDEITLQVCKDTQNVLWDYVVDPRNDSKKMEMIEIATREDEIKLQYWKIFKSKFIDDPTLKTDPDLQRKVRIIRERGTNVQMPQSKQRQEIDEMQKIWSRAAVCKYNSTCTKDDLKLMSEIIGILKTSRDSKELLHYWKGFHDVTGRKIRPIFKDYVTRVNNVAVSENFSDAGDMWRYNFEDESFNETVESLWDQVKPLYDELKSYVKRKLQVVYKNEIDRNSESIPAHFTGNLWAQEWQSLYNLLTPYPEHPLPVLKNYSHLTSHQIFDIVDEFYSSIGFQSSADSYAQINVTNTPTNCLPSSHDMCDGENYRVRWCGGMGIGTLSRAARLLGHVQYFKQYSHQPLLYRDGPTPAFHDALSEIVSIQVSTPAHLYSRRLIDKSALTDEASINYLMWLALEKLPLLAYAYSLDKWRWRIFEDPDIESWNQLWWNIRENLTGISPPLQRNEFDLDPASKYHVISHVQYMTYFISHILEFQVLRALCMLLGHTGPLYSCNLYGQTTVGDHLIDGMSLGASRNWRIVLHTITNETEVSTKGILQFFTPLRNFLEEDAARAALINETDATTPIIVGVLIVLLTLFILIVYFIKKFHLFPKILKAFGLSKNGSFDVSNKDGLAMGKVNEAADVK